LAQVKAFSVEASALSKSAPPIVLKADVSAVVKAQQQVEASAAKAAVAAEKAANRDAAAWVKASQEAIWAAEKQEAAQEKAYQKAATEAEKAAQRTAAAQQQLNALAAGTAGEKGSSAFATKKAEIDRLLALTGDQVAADKALKLAQMDVARGLVQQGPAADVAEKGYNRANAGAMNLFHQLKDIGAGLVSGQNPLQVLAQQLPQVADSFEMGGGAAATMGSAVGAMQTGLTALAAVAVPLTITIAALAAVYSEVANDAMTTTAAPYLSTVRAFSRNLSSPSFSEIEFTMPLP
jgi:chemotaxis protein histidine kinase CheA